MVQGTRRIPADAAGDTWPRHGAGGDERHGREQARALVDAHLAEGLSLAHRQRGHLGEDDPPHERAIDRHGQLRRCGRDELERVASVAEQCSRVGPPLHHRPDGDVAREAPVEQLDQVGVPGRAVGAPEQRGVDRHAAAARGRGLVPARAGGVARLDAEDPGVAVEQVVPGAQDVTVRDRGDPHADDLPHDRVVHHEAREVGDVVGARKVAGGVEPVRPDEVALVQPELPRPRVHHRHEARLAAAAHVGRERIGRVVRAGDQRGLEQLAHGQPLARPEGDRRVLGLRGVAADGHDLVRLRVLERQQDGHQLRQARDRDRSVRVVAEQHLARGAVLDQPGTAGHLRRRAEHGRDEHESRGGGNQKALHRGASLVAGVSGCGCARRRSGRSA